ncbi:ThuA domain-containing protein [bacterium]|nr:ThuA domain-containing protein [bacterium]
MQSFPPNQPLAIGGTERFPYGLIWLLMLVFFTGIMFADSRRHVALIAGPITGHPKDAHEYEKAVTLIKHCLETSSNAPDLEISAHYHGWPKNPEVLEKADAILLVSDGSDHDETMHPFYRDDRFEILKRAMNRGCGIMVLHWSTFHPARHHADITEWIGGYFDYETGPEPRKWFSKIQTWLDTVQLGTPNHPVLKGVKPFELKDEYYYNIKFRESDPRLAPILKVNPPNEPNADTVAWAVERDNGSRGFGFTGGHFHDSWWIPEFRRMLLNATVWTAGLDVPEFGIQCELAPRFKTMILTGDNHPAHPWEQTTTALIHAIEIDPRNLAHVTETPEQWLIKNDPSDYDLLVMNYCNWESPGWSDVAKNRLTDYVKSGGGLAFIHFSNGAFHASLPGAEDSDWPGYRELVRRVWDHKADSGHDAYGNFNVTMSEVNHPITRGLEDFTTKDELYFNQEGDYPVQALAYAISSVTKKPEPMAWAYKVGNGRVFQTVLGHSNESIQQAANLIQRGCTWAARQTPLTFDPPTSIVQSAIFRSGSQWKPKQP